MLIGYEGAHAFSMSIFGGDEHLRKRPKEGGSPTAALRCRPPTSPRFFGIMNKERAMTKTLVALVLIAGGILLVTRVGRYRKACASQTVAAYERGPNV